MNEVTNKSKNKLNYILHEHTYVEFTKDHEDGLVEGPCFNMGPSKN